ncbi:MAG: efflux RND transporter permease subunit [Acidobacteriaceae bacterium]|nr:efflux RND transporter permease subunit [Acidobacteriaceae bacterium]MBV9498852.1 efflux RND transporter permease subunit [Acidobacteriaceae bacterium]
MWIVRLALRRPYTFVVLSLMLFILAPVVISRTPTDIFPNIDIPVVSIVWQYTGLSAEEMSDRIVYINERSLTTTVNNIEHIESQSMNGIGVVKVFFQPHANLYAGIAQVTAICQTQLKGLPPGTTPPLIISYNASTVPIVQLALSGRGLTEQQLNDLGQNFIRTQLVTIPGTAVPYSYGGKQREIMVDLNTQALQAKRLGPSDVVNAIGDQNLILPGGSSKIGTLEYEVQINGSPKSVAELNNLPIRTQNGATIYIRDVAHVRDGYPPQTNLVRSDGQRGSLMTILKSGDVSTLDIIAGIRKLLPSIAGTLPPELRITPIADQSIFVRASISAVVREAVIAACLTAIMILVFLGSWRSTLIIAISIPLSILCSIFALSALGETINIMTLGGLALAVGILVDDATVEIENINRNFEMGKEIEQAILDGAAQIAVPAFVSTLCICIVFVPMFFLTGVARYLFVPLAEAVSFAMLASYVLSRTIVPTLAKYLLKGHSHHDAVAHANFRNPFVRIQLMFENGFEKVRGGYRNVLERCIRRKGLFASIFFLCCVASFALAPWLGQDFFPSSDSGQFRLHVRARTGTRIEETARIFDLVENSIREVIPPDQLVNILDNIGLPYSGTNTSYSNNGTIGPADGDILVSLSEKHSATDEYVRELRRRLPQQFPGVLFYFLPADLVSQILNFGLPAPIDIQIVGRNLEANRAFADRLLQQIKLIPGTTDLRIQQPFNQPKLFINLDRTKAQQVGYTARDIAGNILVALSGSFQTSPTFWLNPRTGVSYNVAAQSPQYDMDSLQDLRNIPIATGTNNAPQILASLATLQRGTGLATVSHYNIAPVIDIYGSVQDTDLGSVSSQIDRVVAADTKYLVRGSSIKVRGQIDTMHSSFEGLLAGLGFSIILVYMLIVINFQSWLDPFIIISALPAALAGIVWFLFLTHTTVSVPALTGSIMCMGVATANSILVVSFAKEQLPDVDSAADAALLAGYTRFRPVLMTALAMIIGMLPMALGLGEGSEQNAPLGRAVIGGLLFATVATLFFVPVFFSLLHRRRKTA